jgi:aminopeptidase
MRELWREIVVRGAYPRPVIADDMLAELFYRYASQELLEYVSPIDRFIAEKITVRISILSPQHTKPLISIDPERIRVRSKADKVFTEIFMKRDVAGDLRWVVAPYPTRALAQEASMSTIEFEEFVYRALKLYEVDPTSAWVIQAKKQEKIIALLSKVDELHIVSENADLLVKVGGGHGLTIMVKTTCLVGRCSQHHMKIALKGLSHLNIQLCTEVMKLRV